MVYWRGKESAQEATAMAAIGRCRAPGTGGHNPGMAAATATGAAGPGCSAAEPTAVEAALGACVGPGV